MILLTCIATPIFIHTFVVFVRLYWFEKRFQNVVLESQRLRRTRERSRTKTENDDRRLDLEEKGVGHKKITVVHPDQRVIKEAEEDELSRTEKPSDASNEPLNDGTSQRSMHGNRTAQQMEKDVDRVTTNNHPRHSAERRPSSKHDFADSTNNSTTLNDDEAKKSTAPLHRGITFADELKTAHPEDSDMARMPAPRSTEQHIEFLEKQRNEKDKGILYIPGPRDFDRGDKPKQLEDEQSDGLERAGTTETFPSLRQDVYKTHTDDEYELNADDHPPRDRKESDDAVSPLSSRGQQLFSKLKDSVPSQLPAVHHRDWAKDEKQPDRKDSIPHSGLRQRGRTGTFASFLTTRSEERDPMPYLSYQPALGRNSMFVNLSEEQREELGGIEYRALKLLAAVLSCMYYRNYALLY